jgi:hypothetical protein
MRFVSRGFATVSREYLRDAAVDGVVTARALVVLGVPESTVYHRCRDGGPWQRLAPGVVLMTTGHPTTRQLVTAALLHGGPDAVLTGLEACRRHGIRRGPPPEPPLHVLVPHDRQVRSASRIQVERSRRMPRPALRGGVPLAPVPRAVIDAARRLRSARDIAELLADPVQHGLCTIAQLGIELSECGRRGSATPRRVLREVGAGVRSAAEVDAKRLWRRTGLPEPWWNARVYHANGQFLGIADGWFDEVALAWEINSLAWHLDPTDYEREQEKTARFTAAGVPVLPTQPIRLRSDGRVVLDELCSAYGHAAVRPRPPVRAIRSGE